MPNRAIISMMRLQKKLRRKKQIKILDNKKILGSTSMRRGITVCAAVMSLGAIMTGAATAQRCESS
jgi:hypothetical protein